VSFPPPLGVRDPPPPLLFLERNRFSLIVRRISFAKGVQFLSPVPGGRFFSERNLFFTPSSGEENSLFPLLEERNSPPLL